MPPTDLPDPTLVPLTLAEMTPEQLALRAQRGCFSSFGELVRRYDSRVYNFLLRRTRHVEDAEDLTQEAFGRAWERLSSYDPTRRFSTWLFTIAARLAITRHRRARHSRTLSEVEVVQLTATDQHQEPAAARLWAVAAGVLKDDQYTSLWLRYVEDMSIGEIARVLGKTEVGVRVSLFRARQALADVLSTSPLAGMMERVAHAARDVKGVAASPAADGLGGVA